MISSATRSEAKSAFSQSFLEGENSFAVVKRIRTEEQTSFYVLERKQSSIHSFNNGLD